MKYPKLKFGAFLSLSLLACVAVAAPPQDTPLGQGSGDQPPPPPIILPPTGQPPLELPPVGRPPEVQFPVVKPPKPPQYIVMAFDNCGQLDVWKMTREFALQMNKFGVPLKFTYFVSGAYFLTKQTKKLYQGPKHLPGMSDIGWAENEAELLERANQIQLAANEGHEIGSHAVGHLDGGTWSAEEWRKEFKDYEFLLENFFFNNKTKPRLNEAELKLTQKDIVGFRAPYLAKSAGLPEALRDGHFRYDTSEVKAGNLWPVKVNSAPGKDDGYWEFPLATLKIAGTGKKTLSMDYNFYVAQSHAKEDLVNASKYEAEMVVTYMKYFLTNYTGNRAPIHIGHHFTQMNGGTYWRAMKSIAESVCGLPDVKCVTYRELADYMDTLSPETRAAYQAGQF